MGWHVSEALKDERFWQVEKSGQGAEGQTQCAV